MPIIVGYMLAPQSEGLALEAAIPVLCVAFAMFLRNQAQKGPRNALQLDHKAGEVRLGSINEHGVFARHRVCQFRHIDKVYIDRKNKTSPVLCIDVNGETAKIRFNNTDDFSLTMIAGQIAAERDKAVAMPLKTRIQTKLLGLEAGAREVRTRVKSRMVQTRAM